MRIRLKLLLISLITFLCQSLLADVKVDLSKLETSTQKNLINQFPEILKRKHSYSEIDLLLKWIVQHEKVESARALLSNDQETVFIETGETIRIQKMTFSRNSQITESEARQEFGAFEGTVFHQDTLIEAAERLRQLYRSRGFYSAKIDLEFTQIDKTKMDVKVITQEGVQTKVSQFIIQTTNENLKKKLTSLLRPYVGVPYNGQLIVSVKKDIVQYFADNNFFKADLSEPKAIISADERFASLEIKIDHPDEYTIEVTGDQKISFSSIKDKIGLNQVSKTVQSFAPEIASKIRNYYISQGFPKVEVKVEDDVDYQNFQRKILVQISEGSQVEIEKIEFTGRLSQPASYYVDFLKENSSPIVEDGFFVKNDVEQGIKNLIIERQNRGHLKAKLISFRSAYNRDNNRIHLFINFDEGPITEIQKIAFEGNKDFNAGELQGILGLNPNQPLTLIQLDEGLLNLKRFYLNHGYLEMHIRNEKDDLVTYSEDNTLASLKIQINEGPKVVVGSIVIEGTQTTKDFVILNELDFSVGSTLTPARIDESVSRLQRLGFFSTVDIRTVEQKTMVSHRTVIVQVAERDPGLFEMGVGGTNERTLTLRGYMGVAYRNIQGKGQIASLRADLNYNVYDIKYPERKISFVYLYPYIFNTRNKFRTNFSQSVLISSFSNLSNLIASEAKQTAFSFERDLSTHSFVSWDFITWTKYNTFAITGPAISGQNELDIGTTGFTVEFDLRDHPFNPKHGNISRVSAEYGSPELGGSRDITFYRALANFTQYNSVTNKLVWANSVRVGLLKNLGASGVPYEKKGFILGGQTTIRGFSPSEAFPNTTDLGGTVDYRLTESANMYLFKSEFRFPVWNNFGAAIFYDGGTVLIPNFDFPYRHSVGISGRFNTPVGPVSLEFGWKLNAKASRNESPMAIHLSVGSF